MRHIKSFQTKPYAENVYNLEDYVLLNKTHDNKPAKLIDVGEDSGPAGKLYYWITVQTTGKHLWVTDWMIDRKLNDEEIEQFELDSKLNKYNI